ncbi:tetratricopeptide repeat protein [Pseudoalteromonas luteoviolacea]|uniref:tetratricopeptide repeat protein n=1 Tax=Pseudoalteromonas luteoviolacea TaxID=43657 RepID=UPI001B37A974|nr:tetratricopeptide repeat protein [Pseudoalteromonas luteoviolacea]MBQ4811708.1 tetratricopeptide repeat protein [Pseudoalteromonas luteoviolacea]
MKRAFALCVFTVALVGCKSLVEKGHNLFQAGMYTQSAEYYEQALVEDPHNIEAQKGLAQARNKILDKGLIDVRMLRLGGNQTGATLRLESLLRNQIDWQVEPLGAIANTQSEELAYAAQWLKQQAKLLSQSHYPDKFRYFEHSYSFLISNAQLAPLFAQHRASLQNKAHAQCRQMASQATQRRFYLRQFAEKYCMSWSLPQNFQPISKDPSRYSRISLSPDFAVKLHQTSRQANTLNTASLAFKQIFRESLWYSPIGQQTFSLGFQAKLEHSRDAKLVNRQKHYTIVEERINPQDPKDTLDVEVKKAYSYPVTEFTEQFSIDATYKGVVARQSIEFKVDDSHTHYTQSHHADFPQLDITPMQATFLDVETRIDKQLSALQSHFKVQLERVWKETHCNGLIGAQYGEYILRCGKIAPHNEFVNSWFKKQFGLAYHEMAALYAL